MISVCTVWAEHDKEHYDILQSTIPRFAEVVSVRHVLDANANKDSIRVLERSHLLTRVELTTRELDFAAMKNIALKFAQGSWVLFADADERLLTHQHEQLDELIRQTPDHVGGFLFNVCGWTPSISDEPSASLTTKQVRLFRNQKGFEYKGRVHEVIAPSIHAKGYAIGETGFFLHHEGYSINGDAMLHKARRNFALLEKEIAHGAYDARTALYFENTRNLISLLEK